MPLGSRNQMRMQGKITRVQGQVVTLLVRNEGTVSTATPLDIIAGDLPDPASPDTKYSIYAMVEILPGAVDYGEGGTAVRRRAKIEIASDWGTQVKTCYAVVLQDGSTMLKKSSALNDSQTQYVLEVEGYLKSNSST